MTWGNHALLLPTVWETEEEKWYCKWCPTGPRLSPFQNRQKNHSRVPSTFGVRPKDVQSLLGADLTWAPKLIDKKCLAARGAQAFRTSAVSSWCGCYRPTNDNYNPLIVSMEVLLLVISFLTLARNIDRFLVLAFICHCFRMPFVLPRLHQVLKAASQGVYE